MLLFFAYKSLRLSLRLPSWNCSSVALNLGLKCCSPSYSISKLLLDKKKSYLSLQFFLFTYRSGNVFCRITGMFNNSDTCLTANSPFDKEHNGHPAPLCKWSRILCWNSP